MQTAAEILAAINALPTEEHAKFATDFQNDQGSVVKAARSKAFAAGKTEGAKGGTQAAADLVKATEQIEELEGKVTELTDNKPDVKAIEERVTAAMQKKLDAEKKRADTVEAALRTERRKIALVELSSALTAKQEDGTQVDPDWVGDTKLMEARWGDRLVEKDDGTLRYLQLGSEQAFEPGDGETAAGLLAAAIRTTVPARYVLTDDDTGGGLNGGAAGGSRRSGYDPVKAGKAAAEAQKVTAKKDDNLAFR